MKKLQEVILGDRYSDFDTLSNPEKTSYVVGSELWVQKDFSFLLKEFIVDVWELRKLTKDACPGPQSDSSGWDRGQDGEFSNGRNGKSGELSHSSDVIDACTCINSVDLHVNVCGSAQYGGCVVNGNVAMAAC